MTLPLAVGFDLGDTLCEYAGVPLNWEREYPAALRAVARASQCELTPERLASGCASLLRFNTRVTPRPEHREYTASRIFRELLHEWGQPEDFLAGAVSAFFSHFRQSLRPVPSANELLQQLQRLGVPFGVLTDVPYSMPHSLVVADLAESGLSVPAERLLTSTMVGHRKPHVAGFRALAAVLGVALTDMVYVGNEQKDIVGGKDAGCRTVLLCRSGEPPEWGQHTTIRSLCQLIDVG